MQISLSQAKAQLTELVRRAENGEDVVLTRHGRPAAHIVAVRPPVDRQARRRALERFRGCMAGTPGPDAARSQDFLYDENGLPG